MERDGQRVDTARREVQRAPREQQELPGLVETAREQTKVWMTPEVVQQPLSLTGSRY
jgi:hypothetical protein